MARISVVMCCYNSERYIKETIDSVLAQTFSDFEFIIWNDGSTDKTEDIVLSYQDPRIHYFKDKNQGEGKAANRACAHVRTPYIARIDSDDIWLPSKLEDQYNYMESHPNVVLLSCPDIQIDKNSNYLSVAFPITRQSFLKKSLRRENRFAHSGAMYRTEVYKKTGGYCDLRMFQDFLLFRKMSEYGDVALMSHVLLKYRILPNSVEHRVKNSNYRYVVNEYVKKIISDCGSNPEDLNIFNMIYNQVPRTNEEQLEYKRDMQNKVYEFIGLFVGKKASYRFMVWMKNLISYLM